MQRDLYNEYVQLYVVTRCSHVVIVSPPLGVKLVERDMNSPFPRVNRPFLRVNSQHGEQVRHIFSYFASCTNFDAIFISTG